MSSLARRAVDLYKAPLRHLWELALIPIVGYVVYMFVRRYLIPEIEGNALDNAVRVLSFESSRGILLEPHWQDWVMSTSHALTTFFNYVYIATFWPIILVVGGFFYIFDRTRFFYYRSLVLVSLGMGLILFATFPLAPPRFLPEYGFIDTISTFGPSWYGSRDMSVYYNAYAAMPSMHFGWTVLFGVLFFRTKHRWLKPLSVAYPSLTFLAIILTANHYIIDAIGGAVNITLSFLLFEFYRRVLAPRLNGRLVWREQARRALRKTYAAGGRLKVDAALAGAGVRSYLRLDRVSRRRWKTGIRSSS